MSVSAYVLGYAHGLAGVDHGDVYVRQKNQAHEAFGDTPFAQPGRTDLMYARLSGPALNDLITYWTKEIEKAEKVTPPKSAFVTQWRAAVKAFRSSVGGVLITASGWRGAAYEAIRTQQPVIPDGVARDFWQKLDPVVFGMEGILTTPSTWNIAWDSLTEAVHELPGRIKDAATATYEGGKGILAGGASLLKTALIAAAVGGGVWLTFHFVGKSGKSR